MFLFERLKNPNNKTPNIKKKKQKSYQWEMVWICHSTVAPVCTQASCRQRSGRDQRGTQRPNAIQETANPRIRNKGHKTPTTPHLSLTSNEKHRQTNILGLSRIADGNCTQVCGIAKAAKELGSMATLHHQALGWGGDILASPARWVTMESSVPWMIF